MQAKAGPGPSREVAALHPAKASISADQTRLCSNKGGSAAATQGSKRKPAARAAVSELPPAVARRRRTHSLDHLGLSQHFEILCTSHIKDFSINVNPSVNFSDSISPIASFSVSSPFHFRIMTATCLNLNLVSSLSKTFFSPMGASPASCSSGTSPICSISASSSLSFCASLSSTAFFAALLQRPQELHLLHPWRNLPLQSQAVRDREMAHHKALRVLAK